MISPSTFLAHLRLQLLLRNLGVDIQIDYTKENFEELAEKSDVVYISDLSLNLVKIRPKSHSLYKSTSLKNFSP
ncbi:hypothetical protein glysoja_029828 [Glycine soja]|uniref:Uncharacterized protein n=1 Tax=Glycine soja TaxID=3848 RepID=A0A0B2QTY1_GLYSO|nr:hypothetical protein glysoja_029828 [Glycine soja]